MKAVLIITFTLILAGICLAQTKPRTIPDKVPAKAPVKLAAKPTEEAGKVAGRTYTNKTFGFEVTFPDTWLIPDGDFEAYMKKAGFDLSLKAPDSLSADDKTQVDKALKRVNILLTAYRSMPGSEENAIVRISVENLAANPQIKDAVDYFDAIRETYKTMKLPADFKYSGTRAEALGKMQFGYLNTSTSAGKKRMYATIRHGFAIMFTISYVKDDDLETMRQVLANANFAVK